MCNVVRIMALGFVTPIILAIGLTGIGVTIAAGVALVVGWISDMLER